MAALVPNDARRRIKIARRPTLLGVDLSNAKEELFVRMVCDGLSIGMAFVRAGFASKSADAPYVLFHKPHIQQRAQAILEARRSTGVVTLPEVTDMLKRVFAGAFHDGEYSAAHNAAFSLARLYGHVTDKATLEIIRRPSRDPDAPSETALGDWIAGLPALNGPGPSPADTTREGPLPSAPATLLDHEPRGPGPELSNDINWLDGSDVRGRPENGAPARPVTGTPVPGAHASLLGSEAVPGDEKGAPLQQEQVPVLTGEFPPIEDLF